MSAAVNIVLADALATPVNHTFIPLGKDDKGVFWFEDQSQASALGYWKISFDFRRPGPAKAGTNSQNRTIRAIVGLHEPVLETLSNSTVSGIVPAPTLSYTPRVFGEYVMPERSSLQNRKDLRKMFANLMTNQQVIDMVETLVPVY